jgi:SAM-dependent methyltransferase
MRPAAYLASNPPPYQLLPALTPEEYAALKADIAKRGVLVPVEKDEDGNIIDGHHRDIIARELGVPCPEVVRHFGSEREKREHAILMNLARRHLDPIRWGLAFKMLLDERGVGRGQGARNDQTSATVAEVAGELGVAERTARHRMKMAEEYQQLPADLRQKVDGGAALKQVRKEAVARERADVRRLAAESAPPVDCIRVGDFREVLRDVPDNSAALVFTDPIWHDGRQDTYADVAALASRVLRPGGSLITYLPNTDAMLPAMNAAAGHLRFWSPLSVICAGGTTLLYHLGIITKSKYLAWFVKGCHEFTSETYVCNVIDGERPSKDLHDWEQGTAEAAYFIERLSSPGDLVLDPMCGSGTTLLAATRLGRRALGCEIDPERAKVASARLAGCATRDTVEAS